MTFHTEIINFLVIVNSRMLSQLSAAIARISGGHRRASDLYSTCNVQCRTTLDQSLVSIEELEINTERIISTVILHNVRAARHDVKL